MSNEAQILEKLGYIAGKVDGILGGGTPAAEEKKERIVGLMRSAVETNASWAATSQENKDKAARYAIMLLLHFLDAEE